MKNVILKTTIVTAGMLLLSSISANAQDHKKGHEGQRPNADKIFEKMDADADGKLSAAEVKGPLKEKFTLIDTDADGYITKEEMKNAPKPEKHMAE